MSKYVLPQVAASAGYVPGEQPTGNEAIKLNTNENPYPPSPRVLAAMAAVTPEQLRKYPPPSARAFREAAAQVHGVTPDMILAFNGGDEFLSVAIRAIVGPQDAVAFLDPSYSLYPVLAEVQGCRQTILPYTINGQDWQLPANIAQTDAKLLIIVNPNAPSGTFEPIANLRAIVRAFPGVVLIDEAYVDFAPESALPLVKELPNVILLRTLSKGYSLAGMRFGYAIGPAELLRELEKVRDSYPLDVMAQAAATAAITDQTYARETWAKVVAERKRVSAALRALGLALPDSSSNFVLAQLPAEVRLDVGQGPQTLTGSAAAGPIYEALKQRGLLIRYFRLPRLTDKLRITIGAPAENDRLLAALRNILLSH
jgi:histidinol-phosphate aminotransferase